MTEIKWNAELMEKGEYPLVFLNYKSAKCIGQDIVRICEPWLIRRRYLTEDYKRFELHFRDDYLTKKIECRICGEIVDISRPFEFKRKLV